MFKQIIIQAKKNKRDNFYLILLLLNLFAISFAIHDGNRQQAKLEETQGLIDARGRVTVDSICAGIKAGNISPAQADIYRQNWQLAAFDRVAPVEIITQCQKAK